MQVRLQRFASAVTQLSSASGCMLAIGRPCGSRLLTPSVILRSMQVLQHEAAYVATLPSAEMYERSYMHRDTVTHVAVAQVPPSPCWSCSYAQPSQLLSVQTGGVSDCFSDRAGSSDLSGTSTANRRQRTT